MARNYNVVLIIDEIQTAFGRCGSFYAFTRWTDSPPDVLLVSKSLAGGYYPLSALIARRPLFAATPLRGTAFQSTFNNNPFGSAIAMKAIELGLAANYFERGIDLGALLLSRVSSILDRCKYVARLRGMGFAIAFDICRSEQPEPVLADLFVRCALRERLLLYRSGINRNVIKLAPPITISIADVDIILSRLSSTLAFFQQVADQ